MNYLNKIIIATFHIYTHAFVLSWSVSWSLLLIEMNEIHLQTIDFLSLEWNRINKWSQSQKGMTLKINECLSGAHMNQRVRED